jgi:AmmeMemoRadiSam system protein A
MVYHRTQKTILLNLAKQSITHGVKQGVPLFVDVKKYDAVLQLVRAVFVTLKKNHMLRGCIGTLEASEPLVKAVVHYAFASAFHDARFPPVTADELKALSVHISVLTPPAALTFTSEEDLLHQLRPSVDGLILIEKQHIGTFLPSVWSELPDPGSFLHHLKIKAGLPGEYWSETISIQRYTVDLIE